MLATSERASPCRARFSRSSSGRVTTTCSPSFAIVMDGGAVYSSSPFGPLTRTREPSIATSTPEGIVMGCLPTRDISSLLPDVTEDLAADLVLARLAVGHQTLIGGQD